MSPATASGMPKEAALLGAAERILPLESSAAALEAMAGPDAREGDRP